VTESSNLRDTVLTIVGIFAILLMVQYAQSIMVPLLLSLFIAIIMAVPVAWLKNRGFSVNIAIVIVLFSTLLLEVLLGVMLGNTVAQFSEVLPSYQARINEIEHGFTEWLLKKGINLSDTGILDVLDPKVALNFANTLMLGIGEVLSNAVLIMFTVLFMLLEAWTIPAKLNAMKGVHGGAVLAEVAKVINSTKDYIVMKALTSLATGILIAIGLALVGLDFAVLWGFLAFALNFIPNIGSMIAAVPAVLLSLLQLSPLETVIVIVIYFAANTLIGSVIEPGIMGRRVGLSTLTVFLSLIFWGWLLGPVGMLLSVPLTMVIKFAAQTSEQTRWLAVLLSPEPLPTTQTGEPEQSSSETGT
jgi:predicted PurR-regulated permease PerM